MNVNVDYEKIGTGLYAILDDDDKAAVAFGMIPLHAMETVTRLATEKIAVCACEKWSIAPTPENVGVFHKALKPGFMTKFVAEFQRGVTVAVFEAAKAAGRMVA